MFNVNSSKWHAKMNSNCFSSRDSKGVARNSLDDPREDVVSVPRGLVYLPDPVQLVGSDGESSKSVKVSAEDATRSSADGWLEDVRLCSGRAAMVLRVVTVASSVDVVPDRHA